MSPRHWQAGFLMMMVSVALTACGQEIEPPNPADFNGLPLYQGQAPYSSAFNEDKYSSLMPQTIESHEKVIIVDPKIYAWGAYEDSRLVKAGIASAGAPRCPDKPGSCRTQVGTFHIGRMGDQDCISHTYPIGKGGSLMPFCMFFNKGQSLHGTPDQMMVEDNISHGCVHMRIPDAEWVRYNFAESGTKVVILPY